MTGVRFLFRVTLRRHDLAAEIYHLKEPEKLPLNPQGHSPVAGLERPETVNHFSVAANVRSIRSTLRSSTRSSPSNPPRAFSFSKSASFSAAVPCMSRSNAAATLFLGLG